MARPIVHDDDLRDQLLVAAGDVLAAQGASAMTVRRLADRADTSTTAIYSLFGSKDGVVAAMFREGFATLDDHLVAALAATEGDDPVARVRALAMGYRDAARAAPHLYQVMFACPFPEFEPSPADQALSQQTLEHLHTAVTAAVSAQAMQGDPEALTLGLWGLVHGLASLELTAQRPDDVMDRAWETTVTAVLAGLA